MPPRPPVPHAVAYVIVALWAYAIARALWSLLGVLVTQQRRRKARRLIEAGRAYARQLPEGYARDCAEGAIIVALQAYRRWPEPWECLAWATSQEIERELRRRRGA